MKPRLKKNFNNNNINQIQIIDKTISPLSMPIEILDSFLSSPNLSMFFYI